MINALERLSLGAKFLEEIERQGFSIKLVDDFEEVARLARAAGRDYQMPTFEIAKSHLTTTSAFWLFLYKDGEPLGTAATILQDLGEEPFDRFLKRTYAYQFPHPSGETILDVAKPVSEMVHGRLAYVGELTFHPSIRGRRSLLGAYAQLLQLTAFMEWDIDWLYAFIGDRHVRARLDLVYGFSVAIPHAQTWNQPEPEVRASSEWFVGANRAQFEHSIRWRAREIDNQIQSKATVTDLATARGDSAASAKSSR